MGTAKIFAMQPTIRTREVWGRSTVCGLRGRLGGNLFYGGITKQAGFEMIPLTN